MAKTIRIELLNENGQKVVHEQSKVTARKMREALEIQQEIEKDGVTPEILDLMVEFVASTFENVTSDMVWDGLMSWQLNDEINRVMSEIMGTEENLQEKPENE